MTGNWFVAKASTRRRTVSALSTSRQSIVLTVKLVVTIMPTCRRFSRDGFSGVANVAGHVDSKGTAAFVGALRISSPSGSRLSV